MLRRQFVTAVMLLFVLSIVVVGCGRNSGPERCAVRGKVTVDGKPLAEGQLLFVSMAATPGPSSGATITNGVFDVPRDQGPVPGDYQIQIRAFRGTGKKVWDGMGEESAPAEKKNMVEVTDQYIPAKYNDTSELRASLAVGKPNELNYELQVDAAKKSGKTGGL